MRIAFPRTDRRTPAESPSAASGQWTHASLALTPSSPHSLVEEEPQGTHAPLDDPGQVAPAPSGDLGVEALSSGTRFRYTHDTRRSSARGRGEGENVRKSCRRLVGLVFVVAVVVSSLIMEPAARAENEAGIAEDIRFGDFNILAYRDSNNISPTTWYEPDNRSQAIPRIIKNNDWDVVNLQEAQTAFTRKDGSMTPSQIEDMRASADLSAYDFAATDKEGCNFSTSNPMPKIWMQPILYKRDKFALVAQGCFVMSQTPNDFSETSFGWPRNITSWVRLRSKANSGEFYVFNTHIAANYGPIGGGGGGVPRQEWLNHQVDQANVLISQIKLINDENLPMMLSGDFNSTFETTPVSAAGTVLDSGLFIDSYNSAETVLTDGPTWNQLVEHGRFTGKIDHILIGEENSPVVTEYAVVPTMRKDADGTLHFASDHNAVSAHVVLHWAPPEA